MAAGDAADGEPAALEAAVFLQGLERIGRTGGMVAATVADPWAEDQAIGLDRQGECPGKRGHGEAWILRSA